MPDIDVFDFHIHGHGLSTGEDRTGVLRELLESNEACGMLCLTEIHVPHEEFDQVNANLIKLAKEKGPNVLPLAAMIHPNEPDWKEHATRWFDTYPELKAIKLKPSTTDCPIVPEYIDPIFDFALEREIFIVTHTEPTPNYTAMSFLPSLKRRKEIKLVLYHGSPNEEAAFLAAGFRNVYVEPSWLGFFPHLFSLMEKLGGYKKFLAGTDGTSWFDNFEGSPYRDLVDKARKMLPDEATLRDFCAGNARRFLGIET